MLLRCTETGCIDTRLSAAIVSVYHDVCRVPVDPVLIGSSEVLRVQRAISAHAQQQEYKNG